MEMTEELTQTLNGDILHINIFFDGLTRENVLGTLVNIDGFQHIKREECYCYVCRNTKPSVSLFTRNPFKNPEKFIKEYVDGKKWEDKKKEFVPAPPPAFYGIDGLI